MRMNWHGLVGNKLLKLLNSFEVPREPFVKVVQLLELLIIINIIKILIIVNIIKILILKFFYFFIFTLSLLDSVPLYVNIIYFCACEHVSLLQV